MSYVALEKEREKYSSLSVIHCNERRLHMHGTDIEDVCFVHLILEKVNVLRKIAIITILTYNT